jgi:thymidylate synthase (FAD)
MTVRTLIGDCRDLLPTLAAESFDCVVTSPRRTNGQFERGTHWRPRKPHWDRAWLDERYTVRGLSAREISEAAGCTEGNILFWLNKRGIPRRTVSEVRGAKHWGASGDANPMFGKTGALNPRYVDGSSPERQRFYVRGEGRKFLQSVYLRDGFKCVRCGTPKAGPKSLHAHHVKTWAGNPALRFDMGNVVTLCRECHGWVHSKKNISKEYLA